MHAVIDFGSAHPQRRMFRDPVDVVYAHSVSEVIPALERIAEASERGLWAVGWLTYEAAPAFEPAMTVRGGSVMPLLAFGLYATSESLPHTHEGSLSASSSSMPVWSEQTQELTFRSALSAIRDAIIAGETYQVNYTNRLRALFSGDAFAWYESLRAAQGAGWHAFIETDAHTILSASPEMFFTRAGGVISTRPMKGTARRGRWLAEDLEMRRALLASPKERAENLMIVDLLRNDIGRIAETGTVDVPELFTAERYETVWQLTSLVRGVLRADTSLVDTFRALFPCGSVTGAPKINTMRWIAGLEDSPREVYCGAIGVVEPGGDCAFNVPIRTVWIDRTNGVAEYGVGSGVTIDSDATAELQEFRAKALVLLPRPDSFSLLETMRAENGAILRLSRHLARLRASAEYFGFALDIDAIESALAVAVSPDAHLSQCAQRVRLLVARDGTFAIEASVDAPARYATLTASREAGAVALVALAGEPVRSDDAFLCNKTTQRTVYDGMRAANPEGIDVLMWNERNELTEFTIGNVVLEIGGNLVTPALHCGLLGGVFRETLVESGMVRDRVVRREELASATRTWLVNSVREWVEVEFKAVQ